VRIINAFFFSSIIFFLESKIGEIKHVHKLKKWQTLTSAQIGGVGCCMAIGGQR